jgi:hypothetical protein
MGINKNNLQVCREFIHKITLAGYQKNVTFIALQQEYVNALLEVAKTFTKYQRKG